MSKVIKQMEMANLKSTFDGVRDLAVLSVSGLSCQADTGFRSALRKKKIRLKVIKNSLARKVFTEMGLKISDESPVWQGPSMVAWGAGSIAELTQEIDKELKAPKTAPLYKDKVKVKGAVADGLEVSFEVALKMPTRLEAIARVAGQVLAPASRIAGMLRGPGGKVASQIKTISEKKEEAPAEAPAATA